MQVVVLAHADVKVFYNPNGNNYARYTPRVGGKKAGEIWEEWCGTILFANWDEFVKSDDTRNEEGFKRGKASGQAGASSTHNADRLGMRSAAILACLWSTRPWGVLSLRGPCGFGRRLQPDFDRRIPRRKEPIP